MAQVGKHMHVPLTGCVRSCLHLSHSRSSNQVVICSDYCHVIQAGCSSIVCHVDVARTPFFKPCTWAFVVITVLPLRQDALLLSVMLMLLGIPSVAPAHGHLLIPQILLENGRASGVRLRAKGAKRNSTMEQELSSDAQASASTEVTADSGQVLRAKSGVISNASVWWVH